MEKSAEVSTNDPMQPVVQLSIRGQVDRFAEISPRMLNLRGTAGETIRGTVKIVPEDKYPFKILSAETKQGQLKILLNEVKEGDKPAYALLVENLRADAGSYNDTVVLKTDSNLQPEIDVRVFVYLRSQQPADKRVN